MDSRGRCNAHQVSLGRQALPAVVAEALAGQEFWAAPALQHASQRQRGDQVAALRAQQLW
jgi:hypothetical protein